MDLLCSNHADVRDYDRMRRKIVKVFCHTWHNTVDMIWKTIIMRWQMLKLEHKQP